MRTSHPCIAVLSNIISCACVYYFYLHYLILFQLKCTFLHERLGLTLVNGLQKLTVFVKSIVGLKFVCGGVKCPLQLLYHPVLTTARRGSHGRHLNDAFECLKHHNEEAPAAFVTVGGFYFIFHPPTPPLQPALTLCLLLVRP